MPNRVCHGLAVIQSSSARQLATRPDSTPSVAEKKYSADAKRRSQYISAKIGKTFHVRNAARAAQTASMGTTRAKRTRRRLSQTSTARATSTFKRDPRE